MAQAREITIKVSQSLFGTNNSMTAGVHATFVLESGDGEMSEVVERKFHEVRNALIQALESEPPVANALESTPPPKIQPIATPPVALQPEVMESENLGTKSAPAAELDRGVVKESTVVSHDADLIPVNEVNLTDGRRSDEPVLAIPDADEPVESQEIETAIPRPSSAVSAEDDDAKPDKSTPAQQRTIQSLAQAANIQPHELEAILGASFNRRSLTDLTKREAASLILQLSQRQRRRVLRDKLDPREQPVISSQEETHSRNGGAP